MAHVTFYTMLPYTTILGSRLSEVQMGVRRLKNCAHLHSIRSPAAYMFTVNMQRQVDYATVSGAL